MTPEGTRKEEIRIASLMQEKFREAMGEWEPGDSYHVGNVSLYVDSQNEADGMNEYHSNDYLRLPLPIDPVNPERGLWGMVDWTKYFIESGGPDGEIAVYEQPFVECSEELGITVKSHPIITEQPYLALLLALAHQWQIEAKP